jgi:hypothetical protein
MHALSTVLSCLDAYFHTFSIFLSQKMFSLFEIFKLFSKVAGFLHDARLFVNKREGRDLKMEIRNEIKEREEKKKFVQRNLADVQRAKLNKLMENPVSSEFQRHFRDFAKIYFH